MSTSRDELQSGLVIAVQDGDYDLLKDVLESNRSLVNMRDGDNCTLMHWSAINNRLSIAKLLLDLG